MTADRDHKESVGFVQGQDENPLDSAVQGAGVKAVRFSPRLPSTELISD